jgi:hypothetical protein
MLHAACGHEIFSLSAQFRCVSQALERRIAPGQRASCTRCAAAMQDVGAVCVFEEDTPMRDD